MENKRAIVAMDFEVIWNPTKYDMIFFHFLFFVMWFKTLTIIIMLRVDLKQYQIILLDALI